VARAVFLLRAEEDVMRRIAASMMVMLALLGGAAKGQEVDESTAIPVERARDAAWRFLTEGLRAPQPALTRAELEGCTTSVRRGGPRIGAAIRVLDHEDFTVHVAADGTVVEYQTFGFNLIVRRLDADRQPRPEAEWAEEVALRRRFQEPELRSRAERFVAERYGDAYAVAESFAVDHESPIEHTVILVVQPRAGQLAVYPDHVRVVLNPETGEVTMCLASNVRAAIDAPPAVDEAAARRRVAEVQPGRDVERLRLTMIVKSGRARPVWFVVTSDEDEPVLVIDAETGELHTPQED
jgi:hypothetical protein